MLRVSAVLRVMRMREALGLDPVGTSCDEGRGSAVGPDVRSPVRPPSGRLPKVPGRRAAKVAKKARRA